MKIYLGFLFSIIILLLISNKNSDTLGNAREKKNNFIAFYGFAFLFILFALRHPSMGNDLHYLDQNGYLGSFDILNNYSWKYVFQLKKFLNYEKGYIILNKLIGSIWNNEQFFLGVIALISLFPIYMFIKNNSMDTGLSYIVFFGIPVFLMYYSGLRQIIAIGICLYSIECIKKKKPMWFILLVLFATLFHSSAWVFLIAYPLFNCKPTIKMRWVSVAILGIVYISRYQLFAVLAKFFKDNAEVQDTGAITLYIVFILIYIVCFTLSNKSEKYRGELHIDGYLNLFFIACVVQSFSGVSDLAMRVGYYFAIILIVLLPNVIEVVSLRSNKILISFTIVLCFSLYGLYALKNTFWADAVPYYFFWQDV